MFLGRSESFQVLLPLWVLFGPYSFLLAGSPRFLSQLLQRGTHRLVKSSATGFVCPQSGHVFKGIHGGQLLCIRLLRLAPACHGNYFLEAWQGDSHPVHHVDGLMLELFVLHLQDDNGCSGAELDTLTTDLEASQLLGGWVRALEVLKAPLHLLQVIHHDPLGL